MQSAFYLGVWGYCLAVVCLLFGILALAWRFFQCIRSRRRKSGQYIKSDKLRQCELIVSLQITVIALISTALVFWGNDSVGKELGQTSRMLVTTSNDVLHQVEGALVALEASIFPMEDPDIVFQIQSGCERLNSSAKSFTKKLEIAEKKVHFALRILNLTMKLAGSMITSVVLIGLVCAMGNHRGLLILLFSIMTVLLTASWSFSGLSFVLYSLTNDACQAMKEYDTNKKDSTFSNEAVILLNRNTSADSIPVMPFICDPYGQAPDYLQNTCSPETCPVQNFSSIFAPFHCKSDDLTYCFENKTPIPHQLFGTVSQSMNATGDIIIVLPKLHSIMTCDFVSTAFKKLTMEHCDPLKAAISALWIGKWPVMVVSEDLANDPDMPSHTKQKDLVL
ncbi:hypothetical protein SELMODRAFT_427742 [Selaginella moellendorffii]|uniref:Uncharacterized protein n=1 Tax=Selaginella moellendorffii TaxID=88036 RepID=D8T0K7_SELML|nr:hypothetical protein SELMODRAFT_427742 [Selaginella moellendorffii]